MEYKKAFSKFIKRFIGSIISHPRLIVLLPSIIVFTLSYDVTYDYTIKEINSRIASYFGSNVVSSTYDSTRVMNFIDSLEDGYQEKFQLTTFELGNKNLPQKKNVLTFEFLHEVNQLQFTLYREHNDLTIISPLSSWTIDWNTDDYAAPEHKREFNNYILRIVNSDMYSHADSLLINDINKIARLNILQYKIEKIVEEYDEFIEDFYFIEWLRLSTNNYTEKEELNNTLELFEELLEEIEIAIFNDKDKLNNICISLLTYNKKDIGKIINNIENYSNEYIINLILDFADNNFYEIDAQYFVLELEKLLQGGLADDKTRM